MGPLFKKGIGIMNNIVERLKSDKFWLLEKASKDDISLVKSIGGRVVTIRLSRIDKDKYKVIFPSYIFTSKVSHFAPTENEYRNCRNRNIILSLVKLLKRTQIWNNIENKDFFTINEENEKSNKSQLRKELTELLK
jgi:hypothetical protein